MGRRRKRNGWPAWAMLLVALLLVWLGFQARFYLPKTVRPPAGIQPIEVDMKTTSYCHCGKCCSYKWFLFVPYQKTGFMKFRFKQVGITSSGVLARPGTIAADKSIYPYGTVMHVPGYGYGRVEDTGGAIKGQHIDLYRPNHWLARHWGARNKKVKVWLTPGKVLPIPDGPSIPPAVAATNLPENGEISVSNLINEVLMSMTNVVSETNQVEQVDQQDEG